MKKQKEFKFKAFWSVVVILSIIAIIVIPIVLITRHFENYGKFKSESETFQRLYEEERNIKDSKLEELQKENNELKKKLQSKGKPNNSNVVNLIKKYFYEDPLTAISIFMSESGLRANAKNWNCKYNGKSTFCKESDRHLAWSVDCGITQLNFLGKDCPSESFDIEWNFKQARIKFDQRGWQPWVSWLNGGYKSRLADARSILK